MLEQHWEYVDVYVQSESFAMVYQHKNEREWCHLHEKSHKTITRGHYLNE